MSQFLGLANQNCAGAPTNGSTASRYFTSFNPGDTSWTCPATGYYTFTGIGGGGGTNGVLNGGSGGATQKTALIFTGQVVAFSVGRGSNNGGTPTGTTVTFPSGEVMTAGPGQGGAAGGAGGTATGGDLNVSGNAGGVGPTIGRFVGSPIIAGPNPPGVGAGAVITGSQICGGSGILYLQAGKV
jgi:hypothetical protein